MDATDNRKHKALEVVARLGYAAKGLIFLAIGVLACMAAIGAGGQTTGTKGAIAQLAAQPFGKLILAILAVGLCGYVIWRMTEAWADAEGKGSDLKGIIQRIGFAISGVIYAALAFYAVDILVGASFGGGGDDSPQGRTAKLMSFPGGIWVVGLIGVGFIGVGVYQARRAIKKTYRKAWNTTEMSGQQLCWANRAAVVGLSARGIVFGLVGLFLIIAAYRADPNEARGLGDTLNTLAQQPFGWILLGLVALGFVCYGIYCFVNARFRRINV